MLFLVNNRILTQNKERTLLTVPFAAATTTITVKAVDNNTWADNDWLIIGEIGTPTAEVMQINGAVSDGTSLTIDNAGSGGTRFAHGVDEPVYRIDYNRVKFDYATTESGSKSTLATIDLQPENFETRYEDTAHTTGFGFASFVNSFSAATSPYSDGIPYTGQSPRSLAMMMSKIRGLVDEYQTDFLSDQQIVDSINDKQRDILNERLWTFNEIERSASSVAYVFANDISSDIKTLHTLRFRTIPLALISEARWEMLHWNTNQSSSWPMACAVWNNQYKIYPTPAESAYTTNLNGAINDAVTTITVDNTSGMRIGDWYRFIIDSEVIYANNGSTQTQFTGCLRGQEGTTAASHLDDALVTERDMVMDGQAQAVDLVQLNDLTVVPESIVVCYGAAADLCNGRLNKPTLGDRYEVKYKAGMADLGNRFSIKMTSQPNRVKDPSEVIMDDGVWRNPNDFPYNVQAP